MFRSPLRVRILLPRYLLRGTPVAWECASCSRLFTAGTLEQVFRSPQQPPPSVIQDFEVHACVRPRLETEETASPAVHAGRH